MSPAFRRELTVALLLFLLVNGISCATQRRVSVNHGEGWDGADYVKTAAQISLHERLDAGAPFVYRIGTPLLVSLLGTTDWLAGFFIVNIAANMATTVLLLVWLRRYIGSSSVRLLMVALFLATWHGPVRFVHFYPAYVDPWFHTFALAGLIGIRAVHDRPTRLRIGVLGLIAFAGTVFRESILLVGLALLCADGPLRRTRSAASGLARAGTLRIPPGYLVPLAFGLLGLALTHALASPPKGYRFVDTALSNVRDITVLRYAHAWWSAFGPVLVCAIYGWRRSMAFLLEHRFMLVYLAGCAVLAWIGGTDTERFVYWAMPVVFVLVGRAIEAQSGILRSTPLRVTLAAARSSRSGSPGRSPTIRARRRVRFQS